jgi:hypothetical protein
MKHLEVIGLSAFLIFIAHGISAAGGLFGPPESISRDTGGLHTGIGYGHEENKLKNGAELLTRQNQIYSQLGYGARNWEIYARVGISDLEIPDAFRPSQASTTTSKNDFEDSWKLFGTLGMKGFYAFNKTFGVGGFLQGSYYFRNFTDPVSGTFNGTPFITELAVKNLWDVNFAIGFQATVPWGIKLYTGPFVYYSEAKTSLSADIPGLQIGTGDARLENKTTAGGFAGIDLPLARGFHLNVEGKYSSRFSFGAVISFSY